MTNQDYINVEQYSRRVVDALCAQIGVPADRIRFQSASIEFKTVPELHVALFFSVEEWVKAMNDAAVVK